jgi:hypothetical protein
MGQLLAQLNSICTKWERQIIIINNSVALARKVNYTERLLLVGEISVNFFFFFADRGESCSQRGGSLHL